MDEPERGELHRLRDLDRRGRGAAAVLALLLALIPLVAAATNLGRWEPQGDDALIELRARDVGTGRTPLVGQPSTSGSYGRQRENVAHPGPAGFYVLAPGTRVLGTVPGTLLSTAAVAIASLWAIAWLLFRHLGARGGAAGAVLGALAAFSAGGAGLTDPLSSNVGRFPMLAAAVGVWALACRDLRVLPLTVAFWSFAAQQHLSVLPAAAVLAAAGAVAVAWTLWQADAQERRGALAWIGGSVALALLLWSPVLYQQVRGDPGNLGALAGYSGDESRQDLGARSALDQVANAVGPQPFLGRSEPEGWDLVAQRSLLGIALTFTVVGLVLGLGAWWRRREPRLVAAVAMVGVLAVAGLVTGANIPDSPEQGRLNFFHWAFALSFFWLLVLGWLGARLAPVVTPQLTHGRRSTALVVACAVVAVVAAVPLVTDRAGDRLLQPIEASVVRDLLDEVRDDEALAAVDGPVLVLVHGDDRYVQVGDTIGTRLAIDGRDLVFPPASRGFVHPDRLADPCSVGAALVISLVLNDLPPPPGTEIARVDGAPGLDREALARLEAQSDGVRVVLGDELDAALRALPGDQGTLVASTIALRLAAQPQRVLLVRPTLELLAEHPPAEPALDPDDLAALLDSLPEDAPAVVATEVTAHLLTPEELAGFRPDLVGGCG